MNENNGKNDDDISDIVNYKEIHGDNDDYQTCEAHTGPRHLASQPPPTSEQ